jgi:nitrogen PTS system EIIA component
VEDGISRLYRVLFIAMYLNLVQLAESFGVAEKIVEGWIRDEGLPHTPDRGHLLFDRAQVVQWAAARGLAAQVGFLAPATPTLATSWRLEPLLRAGGIWRNVLASDLPDVFERVVTALPGTSPPVRQMLAQRLRAKDGVTLAPVGRGFALPHPAARVTLGRESGAVALILLRDALAPGDLRVDDVPVTRLLFFIAPSPRAHLDLIGRLSRLLVRGSFHELLAAGTSDEDIFQVVAAIDASAAGTLSPEVKS